MKSELCQWLNDLSEVAKGQNVTVEARYYDGLEYMFKSGNTPEQALPMYIQLTKRVTAISAEKPEQTFSEAVKQYAHARYCMGGPSYEEIEEHWIAAIEWYKLLKQ